MAWRCKCGKENGDFYQRCVYCDQPREPEPSWYIPRHNLPASLPREDSGELKILSDDEFQALKPEEREAYNRAMNRHYDHLERMRKLEGPTLRDLKPTGTGPEKMKQTGYLLFGSVIPLFWIAAASGLWGPLFYALYVAAAAVVLGGLLVLMAGISRRE